MKKSYLQNILMAAFFPLIFCGAFVRFCFNSNMYTLFGKQINSASLHAFIAEFILVLMLVLYRKKFTNRLSWMLLLFSFFSNFIADLIYMSTYFDPQRTIRFSVHFSEILFASFIFFLLSYVLYNSKYVWKNLVAIVIWFCVAGIYSLLSYKYILLPYMETSPGLFYCINENIFAICDILLLSITCVRVLFETRFLRVIFLHSIILLCVANFGIRYQSFPAKIVLAGFEYGWQVAIGVMALLLFCNKGEFLGNDSVNKKITSLHAVITIVTTFSICSFFFLLVIIGAIKLGNALNLTTFLLIIFLIFFVAELIAFKLSKMVLVTETIIVDHLRILNNNDQTKTMQQIPQVTQRINMLEMENIITQYNKFITYVNNLQEVITQQSKQVAIASTTQMLAHDVRKPFSLLSSILRTLETKATPEFIENELPTMLDDVQRAMTSVNGMIQDVMEIGNQGKLSTSPTSITTLIEMSLSEIVRMCSHSEIEFSYSFDDNQTIEVDSVKMPRVLMNIIGNAFEAMQYKGKIWFKCQKQGDGFSVITVGNNGPAIPAELLPKLFETFFTSGKKGGTGLGLAIAKKIVEAHGGKICCTSSEQSGTEFTFTLPLAQEQEIKEPSNSLPGSSEELLERLSTARCKQKTTGNMLESTHERRFLAEIPRLTRKPKILIVDDEAVYQQVLINMLEKNPEVKAHVEIETAENYQKAISLLANYAPDIITLDIDLGRYSKNGFEILREARAGGFNGHICLHSNRKITFEEAIELGANGVQSKPMSRGSLLEILVGVCVKLASPVGTSQNAEKIKNIAIIDDSESTLIMWKLSLEGGNVREFLTPEDFFKAAKENRELLPSLDCVISDLNFRPLSDTKGFEVSLFVKEKCFTLPVFLSTDGDITEIELKNCKADKVISKNQLTLRELEPLWVQMAKK